MSHFPFRTKRYRIRDLEKLGSAVNAQTRARNKDKLLSTGILKYRCYRAGHFQTQARETRL